MELPKIVGEEEWQAAHEELLAKEKAATRERDALAAERRRQPMTEFPAHYEFDGPQGRVRLPDLFEGRSQLLVYHFWNPPEGWPQTDPAGGWWDYNDAYAEGAGERR